MKLSERIAIAINDDIDMKVATEEILEECAALARRVEEAPVSVVSWSDEAAAYVIDIDGSGGPDKRVRIVLDKEG